MENDFHIAMRHALHDCRREALTKFIGEFIILLDQEGFSYKDLLDAITDWTLEQPELKKAVNHLESAINEIYDIKS